MKIYIYKLFCLATVILASLLAIAAFTGSIQAFYYEIDEWLNPQFYQTQSTGPTMHPAELIEQFEKDVPEAEVWYQQMPKSSNRSSMLAVSPRIDPLTGEYLELKNNYYYVNPSSGKIIGSRMWGECCFEAENITNYLYELHHSLTIPGSQGFLIMGIVACLWFLACIVLLCRSAFYKKGLPIPGFSAPITASITLLMLPMAVSSVAMNLSQEAFKPIVSVFSPVKPSVYEDYGSKKNHNVGKRLLSYKDAFELATTLGIKRGWEQPIGELFYSSTYNFYGMAFGFRDPKGLGNNWLYLSAEDGSIVNEKTPASGTAGDRFYSYQLPLHSGRGLGKISQLFVFLIGALITVVSIRISFWAFMQILRPTYTSYSPSPRKPC